MAIDLLILALLLVSFLINLLALCAFWITPGLRTTANRFTINLLAINLIGCCILAPTLFLGLPGKSAELASPAGETLEFFSKPGNHQVILRRNGQLVEQDGVVLRKNISENGDLVETFFKCNATYCRELTIDERGDGGFVITETETHEENLSAFESAPTESPIPAPVQLRCWSIDMTAALGALAVLLVVGDTWCAVTDPLRYHSRISGVKTWIFIALTWVVGILFGALIKTGWQQQQQSQQRSGHLQQHNFKVGAWESQITTAATAATIIAARQQHRRSRRSPRHSFRSPFSRWRCSVSLSPRGTLSLALPGERSRIFGGVAATAHDSCAWNASE